MNPPEFAETYSRTERIRFALVGGVLGIPGLFAWERWALPWIAGFSDTAPCRTVFGINGTTVLWFGLFVGLPSLLALVTGVVLGLPGIAVLRRGQYPPPGAKVFRPTRIRRGTGARWIGYLHVLACLPFFALAIWGYAQAVALSHMKGAARCSGPVAEMSPAFFRKMQGDGKDRVPIAETFFLAAAPPSP